MNERFGSSEERRVTVEVPGSPYEVVVGRGPSSRLGSISGVFAEAENVFVVTDAELEDMALERTGSLGSGGGKVHRVILEPGEAAKSLRSVEVIYERLATAGAHRHDVIVAFGGGVVTDVAGFVASTFNRGMPLVNVPSTLLGQVDAAIGGKTGINLAQGKNLVGTIYQPSVVVCDIDLLASLPPREISSGLAEVVKYGFIADPSILDIVDRRAHDLIQRNAELLEDIVVRCVAIKAGVVARDERESGERAHLNYGHTFAHAFEHAAGYGEIRHGEAVALGMMAAAYLARALGLVDEDVVVRHRRALEAVGLPVSIETSVPELEEAWRHDKKYRRGVRFVLLEKLPGGVVAVRSGVDAPTDALVGAIERLAT
ncbi:MAG: 3-dehydroquinate synthase [Actinomycetota bacterium]|nr:3-dehydroquinate synthase [Actinomycetota bacterium]